MNDNDIADKLSKYILKNFLFAEESEVLDINESFIQNDIIDSTGVIELVSFVEEEFGISVADDEIIRENFDSINKISSFVSNKLTES